MSLPIFQICDIFPVRIYKGSSSTLRNFSLYYYFATILPLSLEAIIAIYLNTSHYYLNMFFNLSYNLHIPPKICNNAPEAGQAPFLEPNTGYADSSANCKTQQIPSQVYVNIPYWKILNAYHSFNELSFRYNKSSK